MASLGVFGDPDGWLHAGGTLNSVIRQLEDELDTADGSGGSGLRPHWYGPAADSYQEVWQQRRRRYDDLIGQAKPAISAISDFGGRLADFQRRAWDLEQYWLGLGLHLTYDGLRFTLPPHHVSLSQELKLGFESLLGQSERDIEAMWHDIDGAVQDLVGVLSRVAGALEDFGFLEMAAIGWAAGLLLPGAARVIEGFLRDHAADVVKDVLKHDVVPRIVQDANEDVARAAALSKLTYHHGDAVVRAGLRDMKQEAAGEVRAAGITSDVVKFGSHAMLGLAVVQTAAATYYDVRNEGVVAGIESNANGITQLAVTGAVGALVDAAATGLVAAGVITAGPVLVTIGVAVVTAAVCAGIGWAVQHEVDAHRAAINHAVAATSHAAAEIGSDAVKDVRNLF